MNRPLVSIGVPIYNSSKYICSTLDSINSQSYKNIEILLVDDCSTDDSFSKICEWSKKSRFPVKIFRNERNLGLTRSCNVVFKNAQGKYFQKLDSDDIIYPSKISEQVLLFENENHDNIAMVFSNTDLIDEFGKLISEEYFDRIGFRISLLDNGNEFFAPLLTRNFIPNPSPLLLTNAMKKVGGYDENLYFEDWDMWLKITSNFHCKYQDKKTCAYRIRKGSMELDPANFIRKNDSIVQIFKKYLEVELPYQSIVWQSLSNYTIYSFNLGDIDAVNKMRWYLKHKFNFKIFLYFLLAKYGSKHLSKYFTKTIEEMNNG